MLWALTTRARTFLARRTAPDLAEALLTVAGAALAATLLAGALRGALPLGPLLVWLGSLALLGGVAALVMAALQHGRVRTLESLARLALKAAAATRQGPPAPYRLPPSPRA